MPTSPRRRRFRFGIRGLLVGLTVLAIPLGWISYELNWIRQRHRFINQAQDVWDTVGGTFDNDIGSTKVGPVPVIGTPVERSSPRYLSLFGEKGYWQIFLFLESTSSSQLTPRDAQYVEEASELFPEAYIVGVHYMPENQDEWWAEILAESKLGASIRED